jgi:hypothetical protein
VGISAKGDPVSIDAIETRLERIRRDKNPSLSLEPAAVREIRDLHRTPGWDRDLRARMALGWLHWYRYLALPEGRDDEDGDAAVEALVPCFVAGGSGTPWPNRFSTISVTELPNLVLGCQNLVDARRAPWPAARARRGTSPRRSWTDRA